MSIALRVYFAISAILLLTFIYDATKFGFDRLGTVVLTIFAIMSLFVYLRREATLQAILLGLFLVVLVSLRTVSWLGYIQVDGMENTLITIVALIGLLHCTCEAKYQSDQ